MSHQERIACILYFTYRRGRYDHILERCGRPQEPGVPVPDDDEIVEEWDGLDEDTKSRFMRAAEDFVQ